MLLIENLPAINPQSQESLLGYSGIIVVAGTKTIYAFNEVITISGEKPVKGFADTNRVLERQLLHSAPALIQEQLKGIVPGELI
ncbi:MAG: hypothetical protein H7Y01_03065 [Ferruginibacter sp.]|nr:hypothetical protein [Chitinophagaceae bacterium]